MVAFDANGTVLWSVANETPQIATAGGGVIGKSGITYDQNGNATGQTALAATTQSWTFRTYQTGLIQRLLVMPYFYAYAQSAVSGGNPSGSYLLVTQSIAM